MFRINGSTMLQPSALFQNAPAALLPQIPVSSYPWNLAATGLTKKDKQNCMEPPKPISTESNLLFIQWVNERLMQPPSTIRWLQYGKNRPLKKKIIFQSVLYDMWFNLFVVYFIIVHLGCKAKFIKCTFLSFVCLSIDRQPVQVLHLYAAVSSLHIPAFPFHFPTFILPVPPLSHLIFPISLTPAPPHHTPTLLPLSQRQSRQKRHISGATDGGNCRTLAWHCQKSFFPLMTKSFVEPDVQSHFFTVPLDASIFSLFSLFAAAAAPITLYSFP